MQLRGEWILTNDFEVLVQRKKGNKRLGQNINISKYIIDINIDRRSGTNINECKLVCDGIAYGDNIFVRKSLTNSDGNIVTDPMDKIQVYINNEIQFTGWVVNYTINTDTQRVELTVHDNCVLLKRGLNVHPRPNIKYSEIYNTTLIIMLAGIVGLTINIDRDVMAKAKYIDEYVIENGQNIYDAIVELASSLDAIIHASKDGSINVIPAYLDYTSGFDFDYTEIKHITSAATTINSSILKPTILVKNDADENHKKVWSFTDKEMLEYLNGWDDTEIIDSSLAINKETASNIAHERLCTMWRSATNLDILIAEGNENMNIDKVIRATIDNNTDVYRVIGMTTVFNESEGYIDKLTLECIHPHVIEYLGDMIDCQGIRDEIVKQAMKYLNIPFHPNMYYRQDLKEWGMRDEALITHTLIDIGLRSPEELTTSQSNIKNNWCIPIGKDQLKAGDIITWKHDLSEMGFYIGNNRIIEVWGSVIPNMTPTSMKYRGYYVKVIKFPNFGIPECWRLKELKDCG
ncbi:peptidoglycan endopeptidase [Clostridium botulinum]|uniref:peptidoglycan endopeptidase n=1 Tax=Clostridium botulinum TaxID=1491 RepID=UPI001FAE157F|nr:peptidoglycan endopeptidase [Clostridium botulinum]